MHSLALCACLQGSYVIPSTNHKHYVAYSSPESVGMGNELAWSLSLLLLAVQPLSTATVVSVDVSHPLPGNRNKCLFQECWDSPGAEPNKRVEVQSLMCMPSFESVVPQGRGLCPLPVFKDSATRKYYRWIWAHLPRERRGAGGGKEPSSAILILAECLFYKVDCVW